MLQGSLAEQIYFGKAIGALLFETKQNLELKRRVSLPFFEPLGLTQLKMSSCNNAFVAPVGIMNPRKTRSSLAKARNFTNVSAPNIRPRHECMPVMKLEVGDRVRVLDKGILIYNFPKKLNVPIKVAGFTGTIAKDVSHHKGTKVSATLPYVVNLDEYPKSKIHFSENELELIHDHSEEPDSSKEDKKSDKDLKPEPLKETEIKLESK